MTSRRLQRVQEEILKVISELILVKAKDPRLKSLSLTGVKVTPDLKKALISYSFYDTSLDKAGLQESLDKAEGFFRREIGRELNMKFTPEIKFVYDRNLEYAQHINDLLVGLIPDKGFEDDERPEEGSEDDA